MILTFELTDHSYTYTITGNVTGGGGGLLDPNGNNGEGSVFLTSGNTVGFGIQADGFGSKPVSATGTLPPGRWRIQIASDSKAVAGFSTGTASAQSSASVNCTFRLTPVGAPPPPPPPPMPVHWTNTAGGPFDTATNWNPQTVPDRNSTAIFDPAAAYTVNVGTATTDRLVIQNSDITFTNLAYTVGSTSGSALIGLSAASRMDVNSAAVWISTGSVRVGGAGEGFLAIAAGGTVESAEARIGNGTGPGDVFIGGTNASWKTGNLAVGFDGAGTFTIAEGALVESGDSFIGRKVGASGAVIVEDEDVNGHFAQWDMQDHTLVVGGEGHGDLKILTGGIVLAQTLVIGQSSTGTGSMTISGVTSGADPRPAAIIVLGDAVVDGSLQLTLGGTTVQLSGDLVIGFAFPGEVIVRGFGPGSIFPSAIQGVGGLTVGSDANGKLTIDQGGQADSKKGSLGLKPGVRGDVLVQGNGNNAPSKWTLTDELTVGGDGVGSLQIKDGAQVVGTSSVIGRGIGSVGSEIVVEGADSNDVPSHFTLSGDLTVGSSGTVASLKVKDGAIVNANLVQVGEKTSSLGSVLVSGRRSDATGSTLVASHGMLVGGNGDGSLIVSAGGKVSISGGNLVMGGVENTTSDITIGGRDTRSSFGAAVNVAGNLILGSQAGSHDTLTIKEDGILSCMRRRSVRSALPWENCTLAQPVAAARLRNSKRPGTLPSAKARRPRAWWIYPTAGS